MPIYSVFADANFWVAKINRSDRWYESAMKAKEAIRDRPIITTEEVQTEVLNFYAGRGVNQRRAAVRLIDELIASKDVEIVPQTHESFITGLERYRQRLDKSFSLTDCISMLAMERLHLRDVLTRDRHFHQAGFNLLMALD